VSAEPEGLVHALMELARQAERVAAIDGREQAHFGQIAERLEQFGNALTAVEAEMKGFDTAVQVLDELSGKVTTLAAKVAEVLPDEDGQAKVYRPSPAPRFWKLEGPARDEAMIKLRAWVEQIYRPMYGHLAALGPCWEKHPLCLVTLDWLSELWSVLYLQAKRNPSTLSGQAEFQTRLLPAAASQLGIETARCEHAQSRNGQRTGVGR
jgi:hypothetical protein